MGDIELPFPAKILWPNGRGNHFAKHREFKKHRQWAHDATLAALTWRHLPNSINRPPPNRERRVAWSVTFYPKTRHAIDDDNARGSLKAYQDGIALALRIDDKFFDAPKVSFAEPVKNGKIVVRIEG